VRLLILLFTLTLPVPPPAGAATLTVTDCGDSGAAGQLRQVIAAATSGDTVMIPSCTIPLGTQITIGKNLVITGAGASQTVLDGGTVTRIFTLNANVTLSDVTLRRGNAGAGLGGAVLVNASGSLALTRSLVADSVSTSNFGGGIAV
jgi:hypothetical protein